MFPMATLQHPYHTSRGRRRGRNQPNNRDYICPCGKSYLSYPALFTHIKIKHNGRAPGQVIKPRSENASRRGRPRAKEVYDSQSDTEDIAANCIDRLCDFVTQFDKCDQAGRLKEIYMKDQFYQLYVNFNPQQQQPKFDQAQDLYQQTCDNVFCQFLAQINKRLNEPFYFDVLFIFFMMLAKAIQQEADKQKQQQRQNKEEGEDNIKEQSQQEEESAEMRVQHQTIRNLIGIVNKFMVQYIPLYRTEYSLEQIPIFANQNMAKLIEHFFSWLTMKKYLCYKLKINQAFNFTDL